MDAPTEHLTEPEFHLRTGKALFNRVWELMELDARTREQDIEMLHAAHASRHHWAQVGEPVNFARGEWQVSRMYCVLGRGEPALFHAHRCLEICSEHDLGGFDLAFAHEALARAYAASGDLDACRRHLELAREAGTAIDGAEDRTHFFNDLATVPGAEDLVHPA